MLIRHAIKRTLVPSLSKNGRGFGSTFYDVLNLTEEQVEVHEMLKVFSSRELSPIADQIDREGKFDRSLWTRMGQLGLLGMTVSEEYGGTKLGYLAHCLAAEEISRGSASVGGSYIAHSNLCVNQIFLNGTHEQKQKYLPKLISGEHIGALAMSETTSGSDVVSMRLHAQRTNNDSYVLNGHKMWITNGPCADVFVVYAKTDPQANQKGITAFVVERGLKGFSTSENFDKVGIRGSETGELVFDNVEVPAENVLRAEN